MPFGAAAFQCERVQSGACPMPAGLGFRVWDLGFRVVQILEV